MKTVSLLFMLLRLVFWTHKVTIFDLPKSVKVREAYVKGNVKGSHIIVGLPHSVKDTWRVTWSLFRAMILPQSVKVREGYVKKTWRGSWSPNRIGVVVTWPKVTMIGWLCSQQWPGFSKICSWYVKQHTYSLSESLRGLRCPPHAWPPALCSKLVRKNVPSVTWRFREGNVKVPWR